MVHRIIARLDIKGPNVIKGIHLEGLRVMGNPEFYAEYYYRGGADELLYMDVVASLYGRNSLHEIIERTAKKIFIPLTVGGGLRTIDDIRSVLRAGADKVTLNTAAIRNPKLILQASRLFGSSTIAVSIEAIRQPSGTYLAFTDNGRVFTGKDVVNWAQQVERLGAGEIILTSIDMEGTGEGFDTELTSKVARVVDIPVVACGGAGKKEDIAEVIRVGKADAVAMASVLHYKTIEHYRQHLRKTDREAEGNTEFLYSKKTYTKVTPLTIEKIKNYLLKQHIECRQ